MRRCRGCFAAELNATGAAAIRKAMRAERLWGLPSLRRRDCARGVPLDAVLRVAVVGESASSNSAAPGERGELIIRMGERSNGKRESQNLLFTPVVYTHDVVRDITDIRGWWR